MYKNDSPSFSLHLHHLPYNIFYQAFVSLTRSTTNIGITQCHGHINTYINGSVHSYVTCIEINGKNGYARAHV